MKVLLIGETWIISETHVKGAITYGTGSNVDQSGPIIEALTDAGHEVDHLSNDVAVHKVPRTADAIASYDVILFSDVGADNLVLHPDTLVRGERTGDFLAVLRDHVRAGAGFAMIGGWMSFSGREGKARYYGTHLADVLPVTMLGYDDRLELPAGVTPHALSESPIIEGLPDAWPWFLGYNRVKAKSDARTILSFDDDPLLVIGDYGQGRSAAFTSDCTPHWAGDFVRWSGYTQFWDQLVRWLAANKK